MTEIIRQATGDLCPVVALSGPSHAEEVGRHVPTTVVAASRDQAGGRAGAGPVYESPIPCVRLRRRGGRGAGRGR